MLKQEPVWQETDVFITDVDIPALELQATMLVSLLLLAALTDCHFSLTGNELLRTNY